MSVNPRILYNFNENSATTIRDYGEQDPTDAVGTNVTISPSINGIGYDAVFNSTTDSVETSGNVTFLNNVSAASIHLTIEPKTTGSTLNIAEITGQFLITYITGQINVSLTVASGTASISAALPVDVMANVDMVYANDVLSLYLEGVLLDTDNSQSGNVATVTEPLQIGLGTSNSANFLLNEFKLFVTEATTTNMAAWIAEPNGVLVTSNGDHGFHLGDIVGNDLTIVASTRRAVVTYIPDTTTFRVQPIQQNITTGSVFTRGGNLWQTDRQWMFTVDDEPSICFWDGIQTSNDIGDASKKVYCLTKDGIFTNESEKTTTYTLVDTDHTIYADASAGAFSLTLPSSPLAKKEYQIIKIDNSVNAVTINGNGNNINGLATQTLNTQYDSVRIRYDDNNTVWYAM